MDEKKLKQQVARARWQAHTAKGTIMQDMKEACRKYWDQELRNWEAQKRARGTA